MTNFRENNCMICDQNKYEWGHVAAKSSLRYFKPDAKRVFGLVPEGGYLEARKCLECGNIQIFTKKDKSGKDKKHFI